ncbi:hypothetical protein B0H16DRAFT_1885308 [Mycena metata]|uniref:Uncharacterized protein n=1 Tax=Mycena metata TaxID=1033252 RepID=A0AAD7JA15_9AGAR|nr:hypothetical protein B0H16DRAFT_1885308 [Mycena metata]
MLKRFLTRAVPGIIFSPEIYAAGQAIACPPASRIVYSPFVPVSQSSYRNWTGGTDNGCWWWATCVLAEADEPRKLQFASVALVMGLIPLTLKDLAWPERRVVAVSSWQLAALVPAAFTTVFRHRTSQVELDPASELQLSVTLDPGREEVMLASSRVHSMHSESSNGDKETKPRHLRRSISMPASPPSSRLAGPHTRQIPTARSDTKAVGTNLQHNINEDISAVHGRGMLWIVPLMWAVYYVAGTLVYSSIMAVTVIELFVWVVVSFTVAVTGKVLALFVCTLFERR